jgi:hypothetical protein
MPYICQNGLPYPAKLSVIGEVDVIFAVLYGIGVTFLRIVSIEWF